MTTNVPRLLSLNNYHYRRGGADVAFLDHDALFRSAGWDTAVFAMRHPKNQPSPWEEYFVDELEFGFDYSYGKKLVMAGKVMYSFEARRKLGRLLDDWRPDIAHSHCVYHHLSPSVLPLLKDRGIPSVLTAHDLKIACPAYKMLNSTGICERCKGGRYYNLAKYRCIHGQAALSWLIMFESSLHKLLGTYENAIDAVVVPSRFYGRKLAEWGYPREKLAYIPNFVDGHRFSVQAEPGRYFLYFGRLAPEKGVDLLISAAREVGCPVKIVGTGPDEESLRESARDLDQVEFLGYRSGDDLWQLVRESLAVVLPSRWYENSPLSILESYASGKPVLGARIGGIEEMIREDETGLLFDSSDASELADRMARMLASPARRVTDMGRSAARLVREEYTPGRYVERMCRLYAHLGVPSAGAGQVSL